jgi:hypothetical protein
MIGFEGAGSGACSLAVLRLTTGLCFSVDEYIAIAKEKHGYNMEQVTVHFLLWKAELAMDPPGQCLLWAVSLFFFFFFFKDLFIYYM